ncbi:hypothetical protein B0H19DRAFT_1234531 [Mycena capillaripes]|nr:hypothetical protein B0H19DRAFT_1234531 [Mycena capillaripes]
MPHLRDYLVRCSWGYEWLLASVAPNFVPAATLCADLPTLQDIAERHLRRFSDAYTAVEHTMIEFEALRTSAPGGDATEKLCGDLKIAIISLFEVDRAFSLRCKPRLKRAIHDPWSIDPHSYLYDWLEDKDWRGWGA